METNENNFEGFYVEVWRKDGTQREVYLMRDGSTGKYCFVDFTTKHVCKCRFDIREESLLYLFQDKEVESFTIQK